MEIDALAARVREHATRFRCEPDDGLVYAAEDIVTEQLGARLMDRHDVDGFVHDVCSLHDINIPRVAVEPSSSRVIGLAAVDDHLLCLARKSSSVLTVLHEIAHFLAVNDGHGRRFRGAFTTLVREHVGVEHASLLHTLYKSVGLDIAPWHTLHS